MTTTTTPPPNAADRCPYCCEAIRADDKQVPGFDIDGSNAVFHAECHKEFLIYGNDE
jgi:glutaredoxin